MCFILLCVIFKQHNSINLKKEILSIWLKFYRKISILNDSFQFYSKNIRVNEYCQYTGLIMTSHRHGHK